MKRGRFLLQKIRVINGERLIYTRRFLPSIVNATYLISCFDICDIFEKKLDSQLFGLFAHVIEFAALLIGYTS